MSVTSVLGGTSDNTGSGIARRLGLNLIVAILQLKILSFLKPY